MGGLQSPWSPSSYIGMPRGNTADNTRYVIINFLYAGTHDAYNSNNNIIMLAQTVYKRVYYFMYYTETESLLCPAKTPFKHSPKPAFPGNENPIKRINRLAAHNSVCYRGFIVRHSSAPPSSSSTTGYAEIRRCFRTGTTGAI